MATVEKKISAKQRHQRVAAEFSEWVKKHPNASLAQKVSVFDACCESAIRNSK